MRSREGREAQGDREGEVEIGVADRRLNQLLSEHRRSQRASSAPTTGHPGVRRVQGGESGEARGGQGHGGPEGPSREQHPSLTGPGGPNVTFEVEGMAGGLFGALQDP